MPATPDPVMAWPSLEFLCVCITAARLDRDDVRRLPVPPSDLVHDLSLSEGLHFGDALWMRPPDGWGSVFVNPAVPEPQQRYAMARALFIGLCDSKGGRAVGLPRAPNDDLSAQSTFFARRLLMPADLLTYGWKRLPPDQLAELCGVPIAIAEAHLAALPCHQP